MATLGKTQLEISSLSLGTVEIGIPGYGIGKEGFISEKDAIYLLQAAVDMGVTYIDTARGYGVAEERIGKSGITKKEGVVVGTKCAQFLKNEPDLHGAALEQRIREDIDISRKNLRQETLQIIQIHMELPDYTDLHELVEILSKLKEEGKVMHVGIATRGEQVPLAAIATNFFETIQTAYSIVDQRIAASVFPRTQENNIGIINRSVLLKGSLTPARVNLPPALEPLKTAADTADSIAQEYGMTLPELAIRFCISHPAVSTALIGTTKIDRLKEGQDAVMKGSLNQEILEKLYSLAISDPDQIDPARWPK